MDSLHFISDLTLAQSQNLSWLLVDSAAKGLVVLLLAALITWFLRKSTAAARHLIWSLAVVGLLAVPLLSVFLPEWKISVPITWLPAAQDTDVVESTPLSVSTLSEPTFLAQPPNRKFQNSTSKPSAAVPDSAVRHDSVVADLQSAAASDLPLPSAAFDKAQTVRATSVKLHAPLTLTLWICAAWAMGALITLLIPFVGLWQLTRLRRRSALMTDPEWLRQLSIHQQQIGIRRSVLLLTSSRTRMPLTWAVLRPVLLLPDEAADWSDSRRSMVLQHELAHIKRLDWLTQMIGQLACALHWFNPLVWYTARRMQVEREQACDDMVLASGTTASDYAAELLHFASRLRSGSLLAMAAVPMSRPSSLEQRVRSVLDTRRHRAAVSRFALIAGLVICVAVILPIAMFRVVAGFPERHPAHVGAQGLSAISMNDGTSVNYAILYDGDFNTTTSFDQNIKAGTWSDSGTIEIEEVKIPFYRDHNTPDLIKIGGFTYSLSAGNVFVIDTVTPHPERAWQIRQVTADIPIITQQNIAEVFELAHQPGFLPTSSVGFSGEYPQGSGKQRDIDFYCWHDEFRTRFALFHPEKKSDAENLSSNNPKTDSWLVDRTFHLQIGEFRVQCSSEQPDVLRINETKYDLTKGRVFSVTDTGEIVQHAAQPRVIRDVIQMLKLYTQIQRSDRSAWLQRMTLDLTGLPPSPAEIKAFLKDQSPQAFDKALKRLLNASADRTDRVKLHTNPEDRAEAQTPQPDDVSAVTAKPVDPKTDAAKPHLTLKLADDGTISIAGKTVTLQELLKRLQLLGQTHGRRPVQIRADRDSTWSTTVAVMDQLKAAGWSDVSFSVNQDDPVSVANENPNGDSEPPSADDVAEPVDPPAKPEITVMSGPSGSALSMQSASDVHFVLYSMGRLSRERSQKEQDGPWWRFFETINLQIGGQADRRFELEFSTRTPSRLKIDGETYKLLQPSKLGLGRRIAVVAIEINKKPEIIASKDGAAIEPNPIGEKIIPNPLISHRLFVLTADNPPLQIARVLPLRSETDLNTVAGMATQEFFLSQRYKYSRQLEQLSGWVLAWHDRHMLQHSDGARRDWLKIFPDGQVVVADQKRGLLTLQLQSEELDTLISELAQHATVSDQNLSTQVIVGNEWDQSSSHVSIKHNGKLRKLYYQSMAIQRDKPQTGMSDEQWEPIRDRLYALADRAIAADKPVNFEDLRAQYGP